MRPGASRFRHADGFIDRGMHVTRLEAFVDAAFAFAVTMLVISIDEIPRNRDDLLEALKGIPAFAASFAVLALFWWDHNQWSRRFGLDDGLSVTLSLAYVFLALIFVYPLKLLFSAMFGWLSNQWLSSLYEVSVLEDLRFMYQVYASAFASMGMLGLCLYWRAWVLREAIGLDALERLLLRRQLLANAMLPAAAVASFAAAASLDYGQPAWRYALPGMLYSLLGLLWLVARYGRREELRLRRQPEFAAGGTQAP